MSNSEGTHFAKVLTNPDLGIPHNVKALTRGFLYGLVHLAPFYRHRSGLLRTLDGFFAI